MQEFMIPRADDFFPLFQKKKKKDSTAEANQYKDLRTRYFAVGRGYELPIKPSH